MLPFGIDLPPRIIYVSLALLIFVLGVACGAVISGKVPGSKTQEIRSQRNFKYINPLLECSAIDATEARLKSLEKKLQREIAEEKSITSVAVYVKDLQSGSWMGIRETEEFAPASLGKVPLAIAILKESEKDKSLLTYTLKADTYEYAATQNFVPEKQLQEGQDYTVQELVERMIVYSDNYAHDLLMTIVDETVLQQVYADIGIDIWNISYTDPNQDYITVREYALLFRILFNASYLNEENSEYLLKLLTRTTFKNGLTAQLSDEVLVAHKFGERRVVSTGETQLHDCGIVYLPERPYSVCIMTRGNDLGKQDDVIAKFSRQIFHAMSQ